MSGLLLMAEITACAEPPPVANAYRSVTSYDVGTNVTYTCYEGYQLTSGSWHRTCNVTGEYTGQSPVCSRKRDVPPSHLYLG